MGKLLGSMVIGAGLMYFAADFFAHGHPEMVNPQSRLVAFLVHPSASDGQH